MLQAALSPPDKAPKRVQPVPAKLEADIDEIRTFLEVAFVGIDVEDGYVSLRAFDNGGAGLPDIRWHRFGAGLLAAAHGFATEVANRTGARAAVFAPPVCVFGEKRFKGKHLATEDNVIACRVIVLDLDERPQAMLAEAVTILGEPTLLVQSGGLWQGPNGSEPKLHAYWRLSETASSAEDRARLKQVRNGLRRLCAGDATAGPLSHPMRWPGSWHTKGEPRPCKVARRTGREIALDDALERVTRAAADRGIDLSQALGRRSRDEGFKTPRAHGAVALQALADAMPNPDATPWDEWNTVGMTFYDASHGSAEGLEAFGRWSSKNEKHDPEQVEHRWTHFDRSPPSELSISSLIHRAQAADPAFRLPFDVEAYFDVEAAAGQAETPSPSPGEEGGADPVDIFGDASPLELAEPPPGSMPSILEDWARDEARRKGVPVALPAAAGLAVIGAAIGCSLQTYSELTHDTIYKPTVVASPDMKRTAAKSMALLEATGDYFEKVFDQVAAATAPAKGLSIELGKLYEKAAGKRPEVTRAEGVLLEAYEQAAGADISTRVSGLLAAKPFIGTKIQGRTPEGLLFRQPSILLTYLMVSEQPTKAKSLWPFTPEELRPIYTDLGKSFDSY